MSQETIEWLNTQCLIGFTEKRGHAWHYRASAQGAEPNHYPEAIPVEEVIRRLFAWRAIERPLAVSLPNGTLRAVEGKKAIVADDNYDVLGIFSEGYQPHQYEDWLVHNVATLLDDDLGIGSALLLRNRGVAVVQVEVSENFTTPEGVEFRPNLLAATSFDGSLATIYKRTVTVAVCDNTTERGLREEGQQWKVKHTRYSGLRVAEARDALALVFAGGDAFAAEVARLCAVPVSDREWAKVLDALVPVPEATGAARTIAETKRSRLSTLWVHDERVTPWKNTAWGVAQAFNTWQQHYATARGAHRVERNVDNAVTGKTATSDNKVLSVLGDIVNRPLLTV